MLLRALLISLIAAPSLASAQTQYYNLDAGHPGRIEDAEVTARYAFGFDVAPFEYQRLAGGATRLRAEPKFSYGLLPFTDIELRFPLVEIIPPDSRTAQFASGLAGIAVGAMHAFNLETWRVPAIAVGAEVALPVGSLAASQAGFLAKIIATKTTPLGRIHINAGAGSFSVRTATVSTDTTCVGCGSPPPIIYDSPCNVDPDGMGSVSDAASTNVARPGRLAAVSDSTSLTIAMPRSTGPRWFAGIGIDRAIPLASVVVTADVFTETFRGLYAVPDWTAELGLRRQLTPLLVLDIGAGRRFAGVVHATTVTIGMSFELAATPTGGR